jgi:hypothetical protein
MAQTPGFVIQTPDGRLVEDHYRVAVLFADRDDAQAWIDSDGGDPTGYYTIRPLVRHRRPRRRRPRQEARR